MELLKELSDTFKGSVPLCAHGTDELPEEMWQEMIQKGVTKVELIPDVAEQQINVNSWCRDPYSEALAQGLTSGKPLPEAIEEASEVFAQKCEGFMKIFGSSGKA